MLGGTLPPVTKLLRSSLYRNATFIAANTFLMAILGMVFWLAVARLYPDAEAGLAAALVSAASLLALLALLGFNVGLIRFLPEAGDRGEVMVNSCMTLNGILALLLAVGFIAGSGLWAPALAGLFQDGAAALAFIAFSAVFVLSTATDAVFIANRRAVFLLAKNGLHGALKIAFVLFAVALGAVGIFASWSLALLAGVLGALLVLLPRAMRGYRPVPILRWDTIRGLFRYSLGNHAGAVFAALPALTLPLLIVNVLPPENGIYFYIAWVLANLLYVIPTSLALSLLAEGSHEARALPANLRQALAVAFLVLVPAVLLLWVLGRAVLGLVGAAYAEEGLELLRILVVASLPGAVTSLHLTVLRVEKKVAPLIAILGFIAFATVGGGYLVLGTAGLPGIGWAYLASQLVVAAYVGVDHGVLRRRRPFTRSR